MVLFQLEALDVCGQRGLSVEVSDGGLFCKRCCSGVQGCRLLGLGVKGSRVLLCGGGALGSCLISGTPELAGAGHPHCGCHLQD